MYVWKFEERYNEIWADLLDEKDQLETLRFRYEDGEISDAEYQNEKERCEANIEDYRERLDYLDEMWERHIYRFCNYDGDRDYS